jgi:hypothetical protein
MDNLRRISEAKDLVLYVGRRVKTVEYEELLKAGT